MTRLYRIAKSWNSTKITDEERSDLKVIISKLVEYPCKIACDYEDGLVDIHIFSEEAGRVTDWLDLQENGAFGLIEDFYRSKKRPLNKKLQERCNEYNADNDLVYGEEDEESDEDESEYSGEEDDDDDASSISVSDEEEA